MIALIMRSESRACPVFSMNASACVNTCRRGAAIAPPAPRAGNTQAATGWRQVHDIDEGHAGGVGSRGAVGGQTGDASF